MTAGVDETIRLVPIIAEPGTARNPSRAVPIPAEEGAILDVALMTVGLAQEDAEERLAVGTARFLEQSGRDFSAFRLSQHEGSPPLVVPDAGICAAAQQQPGQVRLSLEREHEKGTVPFFAKRMQGLHPGSGSGPSSRFSFRITRARNQPLRSTWRSDGSRWRRR